MATWVAPAPAPAQSPPPGPPGSELTVYVLTAGQGDQVWERYGHNAIGIRDNLTGSDIVYNWGTFSFGESGFIGRFLRGEMMYWLAGQEFIHTLANYQYFNRTVEVQELNLSPPQRLALREYILRNALEENRFYRYDYFLDNCSTRVRDALDRVLGGAIRQATDTIRPGTTFRWHALRLMAEDPLLSTGIDIGLGRPTDRPISAWEEMFIPMKVRDWLREVRVPDDSGRLVPLVTSEEVLFRASRKAEREAPPVRAPWLGALGLALGAAILWLWRRAPAGRLARVIPPAVAIGLGGVGMVLLFLRLATQHTAAWDNTNIFVYNPVWILLAGTMPFTRKAAGRRMAFLLAAIAGVMAVLGVAALFVPGFDQGSIAVVVLAAPVAVVTAWIVRERTRSGTNA